jgi:hypothetical protein
VFAETHFISCRNVMIYFNRRLQNRVLGLFHESLCHRGFLAWAARKASTFPATPSNSSRSPSASACSARWVVSRVVDDAPERPLRAALRGRRIEAS